MPRHKPIRRNILPVASYFDGCRNKSFEVRDDDATPDWIIEEAGTLIIDFIENGSKLPFS